MIKGKFEIQIEDFADSLANGDDEQQGKFFNIFFKALRLNCETVYRFDMQLCNINNKLNKRSKESIKFLSFEELEG